MKTIYISTLVFCTFFCNVFVASAGKASGSSQQQAEASEVGEAIRKFHRKMAAFSTKYNSRINRSGIFEVAQKISWACQNITQEIEFNPLRDMFHNCEYYYTIKNIEGNKLCLEKSGSVYLFFPKPFKKEDMKLEDLLARSVTQTHLNQSSVFLQGKIYGLALVNLYAEVIQVSLNSTYQLSTQWMDINKEKGREVWENYTKTSPKYERELLTEFRKKCEEMGREGIIYKLSDDMNFYLHVNAKPKLKDHRQNIELRLYNQETIHSKTQEEKRIKHELNMDESAQRSEEINKYKDISISDHQIQEAERELRNALTNDEQFFESEIARKIRVDSQEELLNNTWQFYRNQCQLFYEKLEKIRREYYEKNKERIAKLEEQERSLQEKEFQNSYSQYVESSNLYHHLLEQQSQKKLANQYKKKWLEILDKEKSDLMWEQNIIEKKLDQYTIADHEVTGSLRKKIQELRENRTDALNALKNYIHDFYNDYEKIEKNEYDYGPECSLSKAVEEIFVYALSKTSDDQIQKIREEYDQITGCKKLVYDPLTSFLGRYFEKENCILCLHSCKNLEFKKGRLVQTDDFIERLKNFYAESEKLLRND